MLAGQLSQITPSDTVPVEGTMLLVTGAGDLVLKGTQPGATATAAMALTAGVQIYIPARILVTTATTATVFVMG